MYNTLIKRRLNQLKKCSKKKHSVEFNNSILSIEGRPLATVLKKGEGKEEKKKKLQVPF
jgi:hypothetical protein